MDKSQLLVHADFNKNPDGLLPCIVQDYYTKDNLMLAYMNFDALKMSIMTGRATFWSRSRKKLWIKGETSGVYLNVVDIKLDCDNDTILMTVKTNPSKPVCHTGADTCWGPREFSVQYLDNCIEMYKYGVLPSNYTKSLLDEGIQRCAQKVGEEATEVVIAATSGTRDELIYESADLVYHLLVTLNKRDISFNEVIKELARRHKK